MHKELKIIVKTALIYIFIFATLLLTGCGGSETAKEVTTAAKKAVEGEVAKQKEELKKKVDQVINLDALKGQKEDKKGSNGAGKEKSEKDSHQESSDEKD
jgi:Tfp pilus assembly protein PilO